MVRTCLIKKSVKKALDKSKMMKNKKEEKKDK